MKKILFVTVFLLLLAGTAFSPPKKKDKYPGFVFIPKTTFQAGSSDPFSGSLTRTVSTSAFWLMDHEVTNFEYREFLYHLKQNGEDSLLAIAYPDTAKWRMIPGYYGPYEEHYHSHSSMFEYPVVNVSHQAAMLYCDWRNSLIGEDEGKYRLPSEMEWEMAARGGIDMASYPWGGIYLRNRKGEAQCNYLRIGDENIYTGESGAYFVNSPGVSAENAAPAPVFSYEPNAYELYNMSGNVEEMVQEKDITRGGGFLSPGGEVTVYFRKQFDGTASPTVGFRLLKETCEADFANIKGKKKRTKKGEGTLQGI